MPTMIFIPSESIAFANCLASLSVGNVLVCLVGADDFNRPATNHPAELIDREAATDCDGSARPSHDYGKGDWSKSNAFSFFREHGSCCEGTHGESSVSVIKFRPVHSRKPRRSKNGTPEERAAKAAVAAAARSDGTVIDLVRREVEPDGVMTIDEIVAAYVAMPSDVRQFISQFLRVMRS
jgi:hypothetical protein